MSQNPSQALVAVAIEGDNNNNAAAAEETTDPKAMEENKGGGGGGDGDHHPMKFVMLALTILSLILSLPILFELVWLLYMRQYDCENLLHLSRLQYGVVVGLFVVFFISNLVVVYVRPRLPVPGLLLVMVPLIVMLTVGLGLVGAFNMETRAIPGSPWWLKLRVHEDNNWNNIKYCIYDTRICKDLVARSYTLKAYDFTTSKFSTLQTGCCKPPSSCEMEYVNATYWIKGDKTFNNSMPYDVDCDRWVNDPTTLCFNCHSCKEGFQRILQHKWLKLGTFLIAMSLLLAITHLLLFVATMWEQFGG